MQDFFSGKIIGVIGLFAVAALYSGYKFVDHLVNYNSAEGRVSSVNTVCSGRLENGGAEEFSCEIYDELIAQNKKVTKIQTVKIRYISPVDNATHEADEKIGGRHDVNSIIPIYVSTSDVNEIDLRK